MFVQGAFWGGGGVYVENQWETRFYSSSLSGNRSFHELWGFGVQDFLILGRGGGLGI